MSSPTEYNAKPGDRPEQAFNAFAEGVTARVMSLEAWRAAADSVSADTEAIVAQIIGNVQPQLDAAVQSAEEAQAIADALSSGQAQDALRLGGQLPAYYLELGNASGALPEESVPVRLGAASTAVSDANDATDAGFYSLAGSALNNPDAKVRHLLCLQDANRRTLQLSWQADGGQLQARGRGVGGVWTEWQAAPILQEELDSRYVQRVGNGSVDGFFTSGRLHVQHADARVILEDTDHATQTLIRKVGTSLQICSGGTDYAGSGSIVFAGHSTGDDVSSFRVRQAGAGRDILTDYNRPASTQSLAEEGVDTAQRTVSMADLKAAVEAHGGVRYFESPAITPASGQSVTAAHGLGGMPKGFGAFAQCRVASGGYSVGDRALLALNSHHTVSNNSPFADDTVVGYALGNTVLGLGGHRGGGTGHQFNISQFDVVLYAWI